MLEDELDGNVYAIHACLLVCEEGADVRKLAKIKKKKARSLI